MNYFLNKMNLPQVSDKKNYKNYEQILKNQKIQFSQETAQLTLMAKIYAKEGIKEIMQ